MKEIEHTLPSDIERTSMSIITSELAERGVTLMEETAPVVLRAIHASADLDYAENLRFTPGAAVRAREALLRGATIVTDTNMAKAGISRPALRKLGGEAVCLMAEESVARAARERNTTRAVAAVEQAVRDYPGAVLAVGNAPTALLRIAELIEEGLRPALVIGVPVGFVNVVESKETAFAVCAAHDVPAIVAMGRKGGSTIAAAICNALLYAAGELLDPAARGWQ